MKKNCLSLFCLASLFVFPICFTGCGPGEPTVITGHEPMSQEEIDDEATTADPEGSSDAGEAY